jgi:hypothetical protein
MNMCYRIMRGGRLICNAIYQILKAIMFSVRADIYRRIKFDSVYIQNTEL